MEISEDEASRLAHKILIEGLGFTYPNPPKKGYMVGGVGSVEQIDWPEFAKDLLGKADTDTMKLRLARRIMAVGLKVNPPDYVGGWYDPKTGIVWIEASRHFITLDGALLCAKHNKQKAIFRLNTQETVEVN